MSHETVSCSKPNDAVKGWGYVLINGCPPYTRSNPNTVRACVKEQKGDLFKSLPVFDPVSSLTFKNYFCAKCNDAKNLTFWRVEAKCSYSMINRINNSDWISSCTKYQFKPYSYQQQRFCVLREKNQYRCSSSEDHLHRTLKKVKDLCQTYTFPLCYGGHNYDNPHCLLCLPRTSRGLTINYCRKCHNRRPPPVLPGCRRTRCRPSSLIVLFDFSSTTHYKANVNGRKFEIVAETAHCKENQVYDPFSKTCRDLGFLVASHPTSFNTSNNTSNNTSYNASSSLPIGCILALFNHTETEILYNGSLYVKSHGKVYNSSLYFVHEDGRIAVCTNFASNYTIQRRLNTTTTTESVEAFALRLITYVGGASSIVCLLLLLVVYIKVNEYKKMSGKILISLSCALLSYQVLFFVTGVTGIPILCSAVAVAVHYFLLAYFTWTSVLAFEMAATFVSTSKCYKSIQVFKKF